MNIADTEQAVTLVRNSYITCIHEASPSETNATSMLAQSVTASTPHLDSTTISRETSVSDISGCLNVFYITILSAPANTPANATISNPPVIDTVAASNGVIGNVLALANTVVAFLAWHHPVIQDQIERCFKGPVASPGRRIGHDMGIAGLNRVA